ncbi:MAG: glycosyltransferase family A protein [Chthoniobacterales bacterium]
MTLEPRQQHKGLSVIAIFFNMRREAPRTLYSLSRAYQEIDPDQAYEVLVIDNGSSSPLSASWVRSLGPEFCYHFIHSKNPSPCFALNHFVDEAQFDDVMILIDGARILSPGIVRLTQLALEAFDNPFVYTLGMHLGPRLQNELVSVGHNRTAEDALLQTVAWKQNGYSLFTISSVALSSKRGFFSKLTESNCFALHKEDYREAGSYDARFIGPGGGLCNLEIFNRIHSFPWIEPIMLLGEATFHQFHGGVATNVRLEDHPWPVMEAEYAQIVGEPYQTKFRPPQYLGSFREECAHLYNVAGQA